MLVWLIQGQNGMRVGANRRVSSSHAGMWGVSSKAQCGKKGSLPGIPNPLSKQNPLTLPSPPSSIISLSPSLSINSLLHCLSPLPLSSCICGWIPLNNFEHLCMLLFAAWGKSPGFGIWETSAQIPWWCGVGKGPVWASVILSVTMLGRKVPSTQ